MKAIDLTGEAFNSLTVLAREGTNKHGKAMWRCLCVCGKEVVYSSDHITRKTNPVKSCGCFKNRRGSENPLWTGAGEISGFWWASHVVRSSSGTARISRQKLSVSITPQEAWDLLVRQNHCCSLSGLPIKVGVNASIDRIDSSKGYDFGNIQWVHKEINLMKNVLSQDRFIELCKSVSGVCAV